MIRYRTLIVKSLSKNMSYPIPVCGLDDSLEKALKRANDLANTFLVNDVLSRKRSFIFNKVTSHGDAFNYEHMIRVSAQERNICDIYVFPVNFNNIGFCYRGISAIDNGNGGYTICSSSFVFANDICSLQEALMFIDSFLFVCELQNKN